MMASGMYYERKDDPSNVQQIGTVVFTWTQVSCFFFPLKCSLGRKYFTSIQCCFVPIWEELIWPSYENLGEDLNGLGRSLY